MRLATCCRHRYDAKSVKKLTLVDAGPDEHPDSQQRALSFVAVLFATPSFVLQALVLWLPLSIWPPLARRLKDAQFSWYLLEVPCLKFYAAFVIDMLFFVSLTFLAQGPEHLEVFHSKIVEKLGLRFVVVFHAFWATAIAYSDWERFLSSKWAEIVDIREEVVRMTRHGFSLDSVTSGVTMIASLVAMIFNIDQLVDVCDLFGPLLALIVLADWSVKLEDDGGTSVPMRAMLAYALLLYGWRLLRVMMIQGSMGPLVLTVNSMLFDVGRWLLVQLILVAGYTAALYALFGRPDTDGPFTRRAGWDDHACETVKLGNNQILDDYPTPVGPLGTLSLTFWVVIELFLSQQANMECMRQYSAFPVSASVLLMSFQAISAIMMINMLIAMMAKTFERITQESAVNFTYLRARVIIDWLERNPAPPPFTLFTFAFNLASAAVVPFRLVWARARSKLGPRSKPGPPESAIPRASSSDDSIRSSTSSKPLPSSAMAAAGTSKYFVLMADHNDEQHVRNTSKLLAEHMAKVTTVEPPKWASDLHEHVRRLDRTTTAILEAQAKLAKEVRESLIAKEVRASRAPDPPPAGQVKAPLFTAVDSRSV